MAQEQEQRYVCKICGKSCVSGKSLGGHMRVHLALIAASKKAAAQVKVEEGEMDFRGGDEASSKNQSNSASASAEAREENPNLEEDDQNNGYELRDNPKKSWRISDPKNGKSKEGANSCRECGRVFSSSRALSGHMRCHSIKNVREVHQCKQCGKEFDSTRALFGHMKCHSKKRKNESAPENLSDFENLCPIRRKRSRIRYKIAPNPSFSTLNASPSDFSDLGDMEEVALCLIMLSQGVKEWGKLNSLTASSDDESSDKMHISESIKMLNNAFSEKKFDDLDLKSAAENEMKMDITDSGDGISCADKLSPSGVKTNFSADDQMVMLRHVDHDLLQSNSCVKVSPSAFGSCFEILKCPENKEGYRSAISCNKFHDSVDVTSTILSSVQCKDKLHELEASESSKSRKRECPLCFKVFSSGQALGGHKRAHFSGFSEGKMKEATRNQDFADGHDSFDLNFPVTVEGAAIKGDSGKKPWWAEPEALVLSN